MQLGKELGVHTHILMAPTIYSVGTGIGNKLSIQIPGMIRGAIAGGEVHLVEIGKGVWDYVHVEDLADLYGLVMREILEGRGEGLVSAKREILFTGCGRHVWRETAERIEGLYRNRREDAVKFLKHRHGKNFWVFNFCPVKENSYEADVFEGRVSRYPFPDHQ